MVSVSYAQDNESAHASDIADMIDIGSMRSKLESTAITCANGQVGNDVVSSLHHLNYSLAVLSTYTHAYTDPQFRGILQNIVETTVSLDLVASRNVGSWPQSLVKELLSLSATLSPIISIYGSAKHKKEVSSHG